jgi:hypothetical protein
MTVSDDRRRSAHKAGAAGVVPLEVLTAQGRASLVEALLAVTRVELAPRPSGLVEQGLRGAVQHSRPGPVTQIAGQERQPQDGEGHAFLAAEPAADSQGLLQCGSRAVEVVLGPQDEAQAQRLQAVRPSDCLPGPYRGFQMRALAPGMSPISRASRLALPLRACLA